MTRLLSSVVLLIRAVPVAKTIAEKKAMSKSLCFWIAGCALLFAGRATRSEETGFVPLFNGSDLSDWVPVNVAPNTFTAKDGMIVSTGVPTGVMRTAKQYENFVLELEWRHMQPKGNAGVFVWSHPLTAQGTPFAR